jgi:hypothetical protein
METLWRLIYRSVVLVGILFALVSVLFVFGMNRPYVRQSDGYTSRNEEAVSVTLSQSLPDPATNVRYCRSSVGLGGRMVAYRFSAPPADLHAHAEAEFAAHWDARKLTQTLNSPSPISVNNISLLKSAYGVDAEWIMPPDGTIGTLYESADGKFSHGPRIFVDDSNSVLYFLMTD